MKRGGDRIYMIFFSYKLNETQNPKVKFTVKAKANEIRISFNFANVLYLYVM